MCGERETGREGEGAARCALSCGMEVGGAGPSRARALTNRPTPTHHSDLKPDPATAAPAPGPHDAAPTASADHSSNNYARPGGQQNVGNFVTGRPTSRVLAPPGGASQISFG